MSLPLNSLTDLTKQSIKLELNIPTLVRGTAAVELMATFAHHVFEMPLPGGSAEKLAAGLFWGLVILIEVNHQLAAGRTQALLDLLGKFTEIIISMLQLLAGVVMTLVWHLKRMTANLKVYCDQLAADMDAMLAASCKAIFDQKNVVDVQAREVPEPPADVSRGTRATSPQSAPAKRRYRPLAGMASHSYGRVRSLRGPRMHRG